MIKHYLKISIRNIFKYKAQTLISVCAIAVSIMLFVMVTSIMMRISAPPIYEMPYIDKVVCIISSPNIFDNEELELISSHNFKSAEIVIPYGIGYWVNLVTVYQADGSPRSKLTEGQLVDGRLLNFLGNTSNVTGELVPEISGDTTIISRRMAEIFFGDSKSAIGQKIFVDAENQQKSYYIKDVKNDRYINDNSIGDCDIYLPLGTKDEKIYCTTIYALLRDGFTKNDLKKEINNLLPDTQLRFEYQKDTGKSNDIIFKVRNGIIVFLFLFLMVSIISFLRQKMQLFRIRQREIALRTVLGSKKHQLFALLFFEVAIILTIAILLSLVLSYFVKHIFITEYYPFLAELNWNISNILPTTMIVYAIVIMISAITVAVCVHRIKRDQTGLALQMKPRPKHRMRNIGLTIQLTISMIFTWITILAFNSSFFMNKSMKIPDNDSDYKDGISLILNYVNPTIGDKVYNSLKKSDAIDKVLSEQMKFEEIVMNDKDGEYSDFMKVYTQTSDEMTDFFKIDINITNPAANPTQNVAVSKKLKETLEAAGKWNDATLTINDATYEISGIYEQIPYDITDRPSAIISDMNYIPHHNTFYIIPKYGKNKEAKKAVEDVIEELIPERIDIAPEKLATRLSPYSSLRDVLGFVIYLLTVVSIVTTLASLYASVTIDTRRRRKEMALRKINGAKTTDICRIFAKTYLGLLLLSAIITFFACKISTTIWMQDVDYFPHPIQDYFIAVAAVSIITFITIAWKIRDIMKVAPGEYLKD